MASHEDLQPRKESIVITLISEITNMSKKPVIESNLEECLDSYISELNKSQHYLANGIFNVKFAEAGLFVQSVAELYCKKVDLLWDNTLECHMRLCSTNTNSAENIREQTKVLERMKKSQRKKFKIQEKVVPRGPQELMDLCTRAEEALNIEIESIMPQLKLKLMAFTSPRKPTDVIEIESEDDNSSSDSFEEVRAIETTYTVTNDKNLENVVPEVNTSACEETADICISTDNEDVESGWNHPKPGPFSVEIPVCDPHGEKLCNYSELYLNSYIPVYPVHSAHNGLTEHQEDIMLSAYLQTNNIDYETYSKDYSLVNGFQAFIKKNLNIVESLKNMTLGKFNLTPEISCQMINSCPLISTVNITRLPDELMVQYINNNESRVKDLIKDIVEVDRIQSAGHVGNDSEVNNSSTVNDDSVFNDEGFDEASSETETNELLSTSQRSSTDSGVFCNSFTENCEQSTEHNSSLEIRVSSIASVLPLNQNCDLEIMFTSCTDVLPLNQHGDFEKTVDSVSGFSGLPQNRNDGVAFPSTSAESIINLHQQSKWERKLKRKSLKDDDDNDHDNRKRRKLFNKRFKLKSAPLRDFEKFFRQHYIPDPMEGTLSPLSDEEDEDEWDDQNEMGQEIEEGMQELACNNQIENRPQAEHSEEPTVQTDIPATDSTHTGNDPNCVSSTSSNPSNVQGVQLELQVMRRFGVRSEWESFILPKLATLKESSKFDIHEYGTQIMDAIPTNKTLNFEVLAKEKSAADVCRLFMASLQLANTSNIEIINSAPGKLANDKLEMKLLTRDRYHEHLAEYEAPSENTLQERLARVYANSSSTSKVETYKGVVRTNVKKQKLR